MSSAWGSSWGAFWGSSWGAIEGGTQPSQEVVLRKHALKRGRKYLIFDTLQDVDEYLAAEQAQDAIKRAKDSSRQAKKAPKPQTVDIDLLGKLADQYELKIDVPALIRQQDYAELVRLYLLAQEMQEEEEFEMLLIAI